MPSTVRCPGCATRFRVAAEQLDVAEGWVRCGVCQQVFEAVRQVADSAAAAKSRSLMPERSDVSSPQPVSTKPAAERTAPLLRRASSDGSSSEWAAATDYFEAERNPRRGDTAGSIAWPATRQNRIATTTARAALTGAATTGFGHQSLTFMRGTQDGSASASPSLRWLVNLAVLLLIGVLLTQFMLQHRDWLAARAPAIEPLLQRLCDPLGCAVGPPRQIEALVIGNSSLTRLGETGYRLSLALRNQADTGMTTPSVELTLTDAADRTLVRRVLMPADLGANPSIAARGEWVGSLMFALVDSRERIAGYRVTAFYP